MPSVIEDSPIHDGGDGVLVARVINHGDRAATGGVIMVSFSVNTHRFDPYKNFKFKVKWDGKYVAGVSKVSALKRTTVGPGEAEPAGLIPRTRARRLVSFAGQGGTFLSACQP